MKRLGSSDSLGALMTICPSAEERSPRNNSHSHSHVYGSREFQSMLEGLDEEGCVEESGHHGEKKRRLSVDQVKALEKNFEVENKLEPDRKVKLAQELGLQPRQVAVWFQNRRARWKTKQLERDYGFLKANYEALKLNFENLQQDNEALLKEIKELKSRLQEEQHTESDGSVKREESTMVTLQESEEKTMMKSSSVIPGSDSKELKYDGIGAVFNKDGSSDSDSSAIVNEENNNSSSPINSSSGVLQCSTLLMSPGSSSLKFNCSSSSSPSSMSCFHLQKPYQAPPYVKTEEHNFFSADEACNFFSDDQAPTLQWYCSEEWS